MKTKLIYLFAFALLVILFTVFFPRESRLDQLIEQRDDLEVQLRENVQLGNELTRQLSGLQKEIEQEVYGTGKHLGLIPEVKAESLPERSDYDIKLMTMICEKGQLKGKVSPLCNNRNLYDSLALISKNKGVPFWFMVAVTYSESHIGVNFAPSHLCSKSNNRAGLKGAKQDDGTLDRGTMPNYTNGAECWLYNFQSVEQFWNALANTLLAYEPRCGRDPYCISVGYVGGKGVKDNRGYRIEQFNINP